MIKRRSLIQRQAIDSSVSIHLDTDPLRGRAGVGGRTICSAKHDLICGASNGHRPAEDRWLATWCDADPIGDVNPDSLDVCCASRIAASVPGIVWDAHVLAEQG